jgi:ubiquinone biosynthesis accessory factor UbiJ
MTQYATPTMADMNTPSLSDFSKAVQARLILLANHVLSAEPVAMQKLQPHAGQAIELRFIPPASTAWSQWLPQPEPLKLTITRAGLVELAPTEQAIDLTVTLSAPSLGDAWHMLIKRQRPPMQIDGDAHLADAVSWVAQNVRWDVAHDVNQWVGTPMAAGLGFIRDRAEQMVARWRQGRSL